MMLLRLFWLTTAAVVSAGAPATTKATSRPIKILNQSGSRLEIHWVHPETRERVLMSTPHVMNGADFPLNSYIGHEFEIRQLPNTKTGECDTEDQVCLSKIFAVSENDDQSR